MESGKKQKKHVETFASIKEKKEVSRNYDQLSIDEQIEIFAGIVVAILLKENEHTDSTNDHDYRDERTSERQNAR